MTIISSSGGSFFALALLCALAGVLGRVLDKRSAEATGTPELYPDYPDYQKAMPKRAALLLDRLLVALQKAVDNEEIGKNGYKTYARTLPNYSDIPESEHGMQLTDERTMDLQRRGQAKGRVYWRCYLNAVTCFKRK
ncbi:uncharacterized protein LOC106644051 [Copidosoma floridanum]|uniref:uncharacterized protein LOC106644051 n=1 Tax=Copidosoma floridanum TaxID=29053 RepID=UPI0006C941F0|nr:uncharacterized protein LOC106644051 [Copidosoma floridanum]